MACGLLELGLQPGDKVVTISANCPEWNFIDMALAISGMIHVPVYPTLSADNYYHIFTHSEAKFVLVSNNMLLKRILPAVEKMVTKPQIYTLAPVEGYHRTLEILKAGIASREKNSPVIAHLKDTIQPDDWVTLIYTSGTTGQPKGVMLSHRNMCSNFIAHEKVNPMTSDCRVLSFLPGTYGTSLIKNHLLGGVFDAMTDAGFPDEAVAGIREAIDCRLFFFGHEVKTPAMFAILFGAVLLFTGMFVLFHILFRREKTT